MINSAKDVLGEGNQCVIVSPVLPHSENTGAIQYSAQIIRQIANQFSRVEVVCASVEFEMYGESLEQFPDNIFFYTYKPSTPKIFSKIFTVLPLSALKLYCSEGREALDLRIMERSNLFFAIDHIRSSWCLPQILGRTNGSTRLIYCTHNHEFNVRVNLAKSESVFSIKKIMHCIDAIRTFFWDRKLIVSANVVTCISMEDVGAYSRVAGSRIVRHIPTVYSGKVSLRGDRQVENRDNVAIVGSYLWEAKQRNLEKFLIASVDRFASYGITLKVIGNMDETYRAELQKKWPSVIFTGPVKCIEEFLEDCAIGIVAEEVGGGFKLKILQYIFSRLPIFGLKEGLIGAPLKHGISKMEYDNMDSLVEGICANIGDVELQDRLEENAFRSCQEYLDPQHGEQVFADWTAIDN